MNYRAIYDRLIDRARNRALAGYVERHHVQPKCIGGNDDPTNIVNLTPEEHYLAHQLLVRLYPENGKLIWAAIAMTEGGRSKMRVGNRLYGWLRRKFSEGQKGRQYSEATKAKIGADSRKRNQGENHPMFGRKHSSETRRLISEKNMGKRLGKKRAPVSEETREKLRQAQRRHQQTHPNPFLGRKHSDETRAKMRAAKCVK